MPDRRAGEAVNHIDAEPGSGLAGGDHLAGRALAHALGIAVAEDARGQDRRVAAVDIVADGLAGEVVGNREQLEAVFIEQGALGLAVGFGGVLDFEMVAPAG